MSDMNEFAIEWVKGDTISTITAPTGSGLYNKLVKLCEQYPTECTQVDELVFHVPVKYIKVSHPKIVSEEQRQKLSERLKTMRCSSKQ